MIRPMPVGPHTEQEPEAHVVGFVLSTGRGVPNHWVRTGSKVVFLRKRASQFNTEICDIPGAPDPVIAFHSDVERDHEVAYLLDQKDILAVLSDPKTDNIAVKVPEPARKHSVIAN